MSQLERLTRKIRLLVPEIQGKCLHFPIDSDKFDSSGEGCIGYPLNLEVCRLALSRGARIESWEPGSIMMANVWEDLKPFEQQTEAHAHLEQYLLKD